MSLFTTAGGGSTQLDTGYNIDNSLRFNDGDSPRLNRTTATATDDDMATLSVWCKRSTNDANQTLIGWNSGNGAQAYLRVFNSGNNLQLFNKHAAESNTSIITNAKFRDPSAWYHVVLKYDAAQSTASDRVKLYVNGEEQSLGTADYPPQNTPLAFNYGGRDIFVGCWNNSSEFVDGYISEFNYVDGQALAPTEFGETNNNGVWIPKEYEGTYGNNGFFLEFKQTGGGTDSSGRGADTSGNDNHFSNNNFDTYDTTTDTPTNNFPTLNPLSNSLQASYSQGNLDEACNDNYGVGATQAFANGKWYWEVKITAGDNNLVGIANSDEQHRFTTAFGINNYSLTVYGVNGKIYREGSEVEDVSDTFGANDIIGVAVDMDSGTRTVQFYKNGSTFGSATTLPTGWGFTLPMIRKGGSSQTSSFNFGNPSFTISSGNSDANGYGNFEYAVPSGYYALCTKNLAEYG